MPINDRLPSNFFLEVPLTNCPSAPAAREKAEATAHQEKCHQLSAPVWGPVDLPSTRGTGAGIGRGPWKQRPSSDWPLRPVAARKEAVLLPTRGETHQQNDCRMGPPKRLRSHTHQQKPPPRGCRYYCPPKLDCPSAQYWQKTPPCWKVRHRTAQQRSVNGPIKQPPAENRVQETIATKSLDRPVP